MTTDEFFTPAEVATRLKVTKQAVYKWMKEGTLEYVFVGSERRITSSALVKFVEDSTRRGKQENAQKNGEPGMLAAAA